MNKSFILALCLDRFVGLNVRIDLNKLIINIFEAINLLDTFNGVEELTELIDFVDAVLG